MSDKIGIYNIKKYAEMDMLVVGDIATPMREGEACNFKRFKLGEWKLIEEELLNNYGTNITAEYLANTYGEVKSKEHAEFIKLLAETNGVPCGHKQVDNNCKVFYVIGGVLYFCPEEINASGKYEKITIPLPPELDNKEGRPKKVMSNGAVYELRYDGMYCRNNHYETCTVSFNFTDLETLKEASDFKVVESEDNEWPKFNDAVFVGNTKGYVVSLPDGDDSYAIATPKNSDFIFAKRSEISKEPKNQSLDEWPKVGDEVEISTGAGVVLLGPDNGGLYVIDINGDYAVRDVDGIKKPKTPEQELRDDIADLAFSQFNDDSYDLTHHSYYLASLLIDKYKISEKCEDDE